MLHTIAQLSLPFLLAISILSITINTSYFTKVHLFPALRHPNKIFLGLYSLSLSLLWESITQFAAPVTCASWRRSSSNMCFILTVLARLVFAGDDSSLFCLCLGSLRAKLQTILTKKAQAATKMERFPRKFRSIFLIYLSAAIACRGVKNGTWKFLQRSPKESHSTWTRQRGRAKSCSSCGKTKKKEKKKKKKNKSRLKFRKRETVTKALKLKLASDDD